VLYEAYHDARSLEHKKQTVVYHTFAQLLPYAGMNDLCRQIHTVGLQWLIVTNITQASWLFLGVCQATSGMQGSHSWRCDQNNNLCQNGGFRFLSAFRQLRLKTVKELIIGKVPIQVRWLKALSKQNVHHRKGHAVAQLVEALRCKPEGSRFDSRWYH
jgi:hypothetical protein